MLAYIHEWKVASLNTMIQLSGMFKGAYGDIRENCSTNKLYEEKGVHAMLISMSNWTNKRRLCTYLHKKSGTLQLN